MFGFKDGKQAAFDTFSIGAPRSKRANLKEVELLASDESPTTGFHSIGTFQGQYTQRAGYQEFNFAPVKAKYFKVKLISAEDEGVYINVHQIRLANAKATLVDSETHADEAPNGRSANLLAAEHGGKVLAALPPEPVVKRLYWLVMIPGIIFSFLTMCMTILFPLTEAQMMDVRRRLDEQRLAKAAAGQPTDEVTEELVHEHPEIVEEIRHGEPPTPAPDERPP